MKVPVIVLATLILMLSPFSSAQAHFGLLIPSSATIMDKNEANVKFDIAFAHPFAQQGMTMAKPREFFVRSGGVKTDLTSLLKERTYLGKDAYEAEFKIAKPGVYAFGVIPTPYYEQAEDRFIIHYAKTVLGAYGAEDGWNEAMGLPVEIIPLTRPFANYAGNSFTGMVIQNGRPLANIPVEVEFLNSGNKINAPNDYFETQMVFTDPNGIFTFSVPWAGWWGFAALAAGEEAMDYAGEKKNVELGAILWLQFANPEKEN